MHTACVVADLELQPVLEVESTSDRLRMALLRLRELASILDEMKQ